MNSIHGQIQVKGIGTGIKGLTVHAFNFISQGPEGPPIFIGPSNSVQSLGSSPTSNGRFKITYDEIALGFPRPNLILLVLAPEEPGKRFENLVLYQSEVRHAASANEFFLIQLDVNLLKEKGIEVPEPQENNAGNPEALRNKVDSELQRRKAVREGLNTLAQADVNTTRVFEIKMEGQLQRRVLEHLTQLPANSPAWERFVPPDGDVRAIMRQNQERTISQVINPARGQDTFLVLSDAEFDELKDAAGELDNDKIEARLRGTDTTPSRLRDDPLVKECLGRRQKSPFDPEDPTPPDPPNPVVPPIEDLDVDKQLSKLFNDLKTPESIVVPEGARPDQKSVDVSVGKLALRKGPADVPAFYDFHTLQIAFDHVWEAARADGAIETAKLLYRKTLEAGGDPESALNNQTGNPLRILKREASVVNKTKSQGYLTTMARMNTGSNGAPGLDLPTVLDPTIDPLPPIGPDIVVDPPPTPPNGDGNGIHGDDVVGPFATEVELLSEGYPFTIFAAGSVNFGILVTYRQKWEPISYQVGRLAKTITLAPKESLSFTTRQVVKTSMSRKQIVASQQMRKDEAEDTQRDEAEIVRRAESKTNFSLSTTGSFDLGPLGEGSATTNFGKDASSSSQETKKSYRNAVRKAAQELRNEYKLEVDESQSFEAEETTKREITNPNDELPITYLFYELQRRYKVSEHLFRVTPVVLVGQYVPPPERLSEAWVMQYDWIIKRFLLDDSHLPALNYISTRVQGDRIILNELKTNLDMVRATVTALKDEIMQARRQMSARYEALQAQIEKQAQIAAENSSEGFFEKAGEALFYSDDESEEATRIREQAARDAYDRVVREEQELRMRLERELSALQGASDAYTKAKAENTNHQVQIDRLVRHVRDYILHYMQGIWSYEHPDQRFFRHHTIQAPRLVSATREYTLAQVTDWPVGVTPQAGKKCYRVTFSMTLPEQLADERMATLAELANLDEPLGSKGNYMIFPLKERNGLTDYMMTPYVDAELGLRDPDGTGNFTLDEFSKFVACLREKLGDQFDDIESELRKQYEAILADPFRDGEEIVVPTNSLYIEALVGTQPLIEDFKLLHRGLDVLKVKADARNLEIENLRKAARLQKDELGDPNVESVKNVFYHGEIPPHDGDE